MNRRTSFLLAAILIPLIFLFGAAIWWKIDSEPVDSSQKDQIIFEVSKGASIDEISERLKQQNLIRSRLHFKIYISFLGIARKIQAGGFKLSPSMSENEIARALTKASDDEWVTIIEGLRQEQIVEVLVKEGFEVSPQSWAKQVQQEELEGKMFPDSYLFPRTATREAILKIISSNFQKKVEQGLAKEISQSGLTLSQILILGSIVEREARDEPDRAIVTGILLKRLKNNWPLQVDATVQYAVASLNCAGKIASCDWWPKNLSAKDLEINSAYNTYLHKGLPPSPICNPGLSSIKAVLEPKDSPYWFYISDLQGKMHYAKTQEEHAENIRRYLN